MLVPRIAFLALGVLLPRLLCSFVNVDLGEDAGGHRSSAIPPRWRSSGLGDQNVLATNHYPAASTPNECKAVDRACRTFNDRYDLCSIAPKLRNREQNAYVAGIG